MVITPDFEEILKLPVTQVRILARPRYFVLFCTYFVRQMIWVDLDEKVVLVHGKLVDGALMLLLSP